MIYEFSFAFFLYFLFPLYQTVLSFSLETSPITDSDTAKRTVFQRSYSVVASEYDKQHSPSPARVKAVPRRRVHSGDAGNQKSLFVNNNVYKKKLDVNNANPVCYTEVGSSLLRHPSPELSRLISAHGSLSKGERNFQWPVLAFVIQHHDLEGLEVAMRHALRKSACRVFAMEVYLEYLSKCSHLKNSDCNQ